MGNLKVTEIKAFVPSSDFALSKRFYSELGFTMASEGGGVAYFYTGQSAFLLQDHCTDGLAADFCMHLLVEDVDAWWQHVDDLQLVERFGVSLSPVEQQPWRMRDFCLTDPTGVVWRIGQNTD